MGDNEAVADCAIESSATNVALLAMEVRNEKDSATLSGQRNEGGHADLTCVGAPRLSPVADLEELAVLVLQTMMYWVFGRLRRQAQALAQ